MTSATLHEGARERLIGGLPLTERRLELAGVSTCVLEAGDGPPLVLLHGGIECGGVYWAPVISGLVEHHTLVVADVPGLGESEPVGRLDSAAFADWFSALLHASCHEEPMVAAHSLLGSFAARFAAGHWGRHDRMTPLRLAESARSRLGWPLHVVDDSGHVPHIEQPDAFLRALRAGSGALERSSEGGSMMTQEDVQDTREAWNDIAAGYDEFVTPTHKWLAGEALRHVGLRPGMRFLDVAAGSGALSIPAARLGAQVVSVDLSPVMIDRLEARARREGLSNLEGRVSDGHALELDDETFDVSGSQFGVMLFPDLPRGVSELARVTKRGGRVLVVALGPPAEVEFLGFFIAAAQAAVPGFAGLPLDPVPLPFQVADPGKLRQRLREAGLRDVQIETVTERLEFESGAQMWDWVTNSNPIGAMLVADLTEEQRSAVRRELDGLLRERSGENGPAVLTNPVNIGVGTK